jgi:hypothetical protein
MSKRHALQWFLFAFTVILAQPLGNYGSGVNSAVSAKPLPQPSAMVAQATTPNKDRISPPPVDAVLANVRVKPASQPKSKRTVAPAAHRSSRKLVTNRRDESNRSLRGISHLIDTDRNTNVAPVNRLIDR